MLARPELAEIARWMREHVTSRSSDSSRRRRRSRRGIARRTLLQWTSLASLAFGGLAVAAWTQERGVETRTREAGVRNAVYAERSNESPSRVRLAQATSSENELRQPPAERDARAANGEKTAPTSEVITRRAELKHIKPADFEMALAALAVRRTGITELPEGDVATFETVGERDTVRIYVARNSGKLSIQGPASKLDAWLKLVETIDIPAAANRDTTKLMSLKNASRRCAPGDFDS